MAFKIQDLMTDVLPDTIRWATCPGGSTCGRGGYDAAASNTGKAEKSPQCRPMSCGVSPKPNDPPEPGGYPEKYTDLALLQRQLQQTLDGPMA